MKWEYKKNFIKLLIILEKLMKNKREKSWIEKKKFFNIIKFLIFIDININNIIFLLF